MVQRLGSRDVNWATRLRFEDYKCVTALLDIRGSKSASLGWNHSMHLLRVTITEHYRPGYWNNRIYFLQVWRLVVHEQDVKKFSFWWGVSSWLYWATFVLCLQMPLFCVYMVGREKERSGVLLSSYKDTNFYRIKVHPMTSFNLNYLPKRPTPNTVTVRGHGFNMWNLEIHNSVHNRHLGLENRTKLRTWITRGPSYFRDLQGIRQELTKNVITGWKSSGLVKSWVSGGAAWGFCYRSSKFQPKPEPKQIRMLIYPAGQQMMPKAQWAWNTHLEGKKWVPTTF